MNTKWKIGWLNRKGVWKYITVNSSEEALEEIADKMILSEKVSVRKVVKK